MSFFENARWLVLFLALPACGGSRDSDSLSRARQDRNKMVDILSNYSPEHRVTDPKVLEAMRKVPRHEFVPQDLAPYAYSDTPLPIGEGQTISQPFIAGYMTQMLGLKATDKVLEIGTGSGYQAAVLAEIVSEVYTIEILSSLGRRAERTLKRLGYDRVHVKIGDGYRGWPEKGSFDAIIVTCAPEQIPSPLIDQLKIGGRMMIPVGKELREEGSGSQELILVRKNEKGVYREKTMEVRFVPMIGEATRTSTFKK